MSAASRWKCVYLAYFSQPKPERPLYRLIRKNRPLRIVELGIGDCRRALRLIQVAQRYSGTRVSYTGIDLFESAERLSLKQAHRLLKPTAALVRLAPGDPYSALAAAANSLTGTDLLLISADQDSTSLEAAWFYVPRMLHPASVVLREVPQSERPPCWQPVSPFEIAQFAAAQTRLRRRAA